MRTILALLMLWFPTSIPPADDLPAMMRYYHCASVVRHPKGWLAIEKYTPLVYYHGRGTAPFNVVMYCKR